MRMFDQSWATSWHESCCEGILKADWHDPKTGFGGKRIYLMSAMKRYMTQK